jgi:predicted dienelactone hydrolase
MKKIAAVSIYALLLILAFVPVSSALFAGEPAVNYTAAAGTYQVDTVSYQWDDSTRDREVPVKIYFPRTGDGPFPLIIISHSLGGSRESYEYLGRHWASYGYISVHVQHHGSDVTVWQNTSQAFDKMRKVVKDAGNAVNRTQDVSFAIDKMESLNGEPGALKGRIDLDHIGMAGHSFGAWTTMAVAGQTFIGPKGEEMNLADPRVKAAIRSEEVV